MSPKARLLIAIGNWLAAIGFAAAIWIVPLFTTLHARMAFTERISYTRHGARLGGLSQVLASLSPTNFSFTGSHVRFLPVR